MARIWFPFSVLLLSVACNPVEKQASLVENEPERYLMHDVYFDLVETISAEEQDEVIAELKRLSDVKTVHWLHTGPRAETGDPRLNLAYDVALHVVFLTEDDLHAYAEDPLHLEVKANLMDFLAAPPVVYDYWTE